MFSKLTMKTPEGRHWPSFEIFPVNFEHISHFLLMFLLLIFEHVRFLGTNIWLKIFFFSTVKKKKKKKILKEVLTDIFYAYIETICLDYLNSLCLYP